ncbi:MAG TPA: hypothetical protein VIY08_14780 [Candidatus Nitrosocosmicus sp.]
MITKTEKHVHKVLSIAILAAIITTTIFVTITINEAFACCGPPFFGFHHHKHSHIDQSINQGCDQFQSSRFLNTGGNSPIFSSGNNVAACANINLGGNAAVSHQ